MGMMGGLCVLLGLVLPAAVSGAFIGNGIVLPPATTTVRRDLSIPSSNLEQRTFCFFPRFSSSLSPLTHSPFLCKQQS
jgi:hypothetical protein